MLQSIVDGGSIMLKGCDGLNQWTNMLLTDSGFYYDNELDKPLTPLIERFRAMLCKPFSEAKILFIPTAAMQDIDKAAKMTDRLRNELLQMGVQPKNIFVYDIDGLLSEEEAMGFDVIYFTGGNTPYLAKRVREAGFDKIIKKMVYANKVYIGMSAGSMLAMGNFNVDGLPEETPLDFKGLGLINAYFSVHCEPGTPNRTDLPLPHIALQCNQGLEVNWKGYTLIRAV
jgi:peptidase E